MLQGIREPGWANPLRFCCERCGREIREGDWRYISRQEEELGCTCCVRERELPKGEDLLCEYCGAPLTEGDRIYTDLGENLLGCWYCVKERNFI